MKRIAVTSLRRLYLKHGIRRKKVRQEKYMSAVARDAFHGDCIKLRDQIAQAKREDRKVLYLDEICFTKNSLLMRNWSKKNSNLSVDQKDIFTGYVTAIISMTEENGIG